MATTIDGTIAAIAQGESRTVLIVLCFVDANGNVTGKPDITADTIKFTAKENVDDADPGVLQKNADVSGGATGIATLELLASETGVIETGNYAYDLVWTRSNAEVKIIGKGTLTISERVSDVA